MGSRSEILQISFKENSGQHLVYLKELTTALVQIEACLNSRPMLSLDSTDLLPLTPGYFLVKGPLSSLSEIDLSNIKINRLDRWKAVQCAVQDFWKRWVAQYVVNLQHCVKWKTTNENIKIDDLVLLQDENLPSLKWKTGQVIDTHTGKDDLIRVVTVRTATSTTKRSIAKLCKLPVNDISVEKDYPPNLGERCVST